MSIFNSSLSDSYLSRLIFDEIELKNNVNQYIKNMKMFEWSCNFNRIFISPGNSFNIKYFIKFLSSKFAKNNRMSRARVLLSSSNKVNQLISEESQSNVLGSQYPTIINELKVEENDEFVVDDIIDRLTGVEFFRLLNIEPSKRLETIMYNYYVLNKTLEDVSFEKLDKLSNEEIETEVPYEIYIEKVEDKSLNFKLKEQLKTIIIWSGLTYGFEQDLLQFAFDSACKTTDLFPIPNSQNHVPVIHVENLARLLHKIISEDQTPEYHYIFAVESPINTLKQIITALAKSCDVAISTAVSLNTFINKYELKGIHKQILSVDIKINSSINQLWPNFEWYNNKSSMLNSMKYLVETYKRAHNIKSIKLIILGPPASGKTKLALQLAQFYGLIYLEPKTITQDYINGIVSLKLFIFNKQCMRCINGVNVFSEERRNKLTVP
ncbi:adenylate kinase 7-like [Rhopalosiphum maidis]|uniref:adenylate kinase 7-like n=1 Tax=Rhopalosiphum maidis TaxID=43146 RepID=UPI000F0082C5|nr:adenylate kinase 7-like [Rhopalosiphum maidis]